MKCRSIRGAERGQGLHFVILLSCVSKASSPAALPWELLCGGARRRSLTPVKHCSLFLYCGQRGGKIFKRRGMFPVYSAAVYVFAQLCVLFLKEFTAACSEFQKLYIHFIYFSLLALKTCFKIHQSVFLLTLNCLNHNTTIKKNHKCRCLAR